jgi:hypothetical protein
MAQAHSKFKVFIGTRAVDVLASAADFTQHQESPIAAKSLGIEYVEKDELYVLTLGYRDDDSYQVAFSQENLGKFEINSADAAEKISAAMEKAAGHYERVLCHEFFVNAEGEVVAVFMSRLSKP